MLVGEHQEKGVPELILVEHALQLLAGLGHTVTVVAVDDEDDTLGVLEVVSPQRTDLVLSTDIPDSELDVTVLDGLDVEALGETTNISNSSLVEPVGSRANKPPCPGSGMDRTDGRDGSNDLAQLELVQNGGLSGSIKTDHENAHLLLLHEQGEPAPHLRSSYAHLGGVE